VNRVASRALFDQQVSALEGELLEIRKWTVFSRTFPVLDVGFEAVGRTPFRVHMNCDDWNELPPVITLLTFDGAVLTALPTGPTGIFHQGPHDITKRPFICMAGSREYHTHTSHIADLWDNYKSQDGYDLGGIMTRIWNGWLKSTP
jgi:putative metal binding uncharacterized protein